MLLGTTCIRAYEPNRRRHRKKKNKFHEKEIICPSCRAPPARFRLIMPIRANGSKTRWRRQCHLPTCSAFSLIRHSEPLRKRAQTHPTRQESLNTWYQVRLSQSSQGWVRKLVPAPTQVVLPGALVVVVVVVVGSLLKREALKLMLDRLHPCCQGQRWIGRVAACSCIPYGIVQTAVLLIIPRTHCLRCRHTPLQKPFLLLLLLPGCLSPVHTAFLGTSDSVGRVPRPQFLGDVRLEQLLTLREINVALQSLFRRVNALEAFGACAEVAAILTLGSSSQRSV